MPINFPIQLRPLSASEFDEIDFRVMGHAFASQNCLGRLCEESAYQLDMQARLQADGFEMALIEQPLTVTHRDFEKIYRVDLIANHAVYELKTVAALISEHDSQLLNYLFLLGMPRGKLINLRPGKVQGKLLPAALNQQTRRQLRIDTSRWNDLTAECRQLRQTMSDLLDDWGGFLEVALYQSALTHLFGGEERVIQRVPLSRDGIALGTQQIHSHGAEMAFRVTAVTSHIDSFRGHLQRFLEHTGLRAFQWINLNHGVIEFVTLTR